MAAASQPRGEDEQRVPEETPVRILRRTAAILRQLRVEGQSVAPDGAPPRAVSHN